VQLLRFGQEVSWSHAGLLLVLGDLVVLTLATGALWVRLARPGAAPVTARLAPGLRAAS
jgi:hypothetical protein